MKILLISILLLTSLAVKSQNVFEFTYDENGNRIRREMIPLRIINPNDTTNADSTNNANNTAQNNLSGNDSTQYTSHLGDQEIKIYPNPTSGELKMEISNFVTGSSGFITVVDLTGRLIYQSNTVSASNIINLSSALVGNYILKVILDGRSKEWVVVKE